jgi:hypothetical protein
MAVANMLWYTPSTYRHFLSGWFYNEQIESCDFLIGLLRLPAKLVIHNRKGGQPQPTKENVAPNWKIGPHFWPVKDRRLQKLNIVTLPK